MSKHTAGPWEVEDREGEGFAVMQEFKTVAARCSEPDARLIASAPTLLEALRQIISEDAEGRGQFAHIASKALHAAGLEP